MKLDDERLSHCGQQPEIINVPETDSDSEDSNEGGKVKKDEAKMRFNYEFICRGRLKSDQPT